MDKLILIDKPQDWTSNDVVAKIKSACKYKKVGHAGTLDPMATGLLIIGYDEGTKLLGQLMLDDKEYEATIKFGIRTDTGDATGKVIENQKSRLRLQEIKDIMKVFMYEDYLQKPHRYSAIKINGKKAYEYAREGVEVEIQPKLVKINSYKINDFNPNSQELKITLNVSKGFYVRSFAEDLAAKLHTFAHLIELRRTKCGDFSIKNSYTLMEYISQHDNH